MNVNFYILKSAHYTPLTLACRLVEKAFLQKMRVFLITDTDEQAAQHDQALWTFKDTSFIPHEIKRTPDSALPSWVCVHILTFACLQSLGVEKFTRPFDLLINRASDCSDYFFEYQRVIEVVSLQDDPDILEKNRQKYKFYKHYQHQHPSSSFFIETHYL